MTRHGSARTACLIALGCLLGTGCSLMIPFNPEGQPCDDGGACDDGYACQANQCLKFVVSSDSLRAHTSSDFPTIGSAVRVSALKDDERYAELLGQEFNALSAEWDTAWENTQPEASRFEFDNVDRLMLFAKQHQQKVRWRNLAWQYQLPPYVEALSTPEEVRAAMQDHFTEIINRYRGQVAVWDVTGEVFDDDGQFSQDVFFQQLGPGFVAEAFQLARQLDPVAELAFVESSIEVPNPRSDAVYNLLKGLKEQGVPVDAVGIKFHVNAYHFANFQITEQRIRQNIQRFAGLGLKVHITAMDVALSSLDLAQEQKLNYQREIYNLVASICRTEPACEWFSPWGLTDKYSWLNTIAAPDQPLLLDESLTRKPAYFGLRDALEGTVTAQVDLGLDTVCRSIPQALACEPFEGAKVAWDTYSPNGQVLTTAALHHRGNRSVWSFSDAGVSAEVIMNHLGGLSSGKLYIRAYVYLPAANPAKIYLLGLREYWPYAGIYGGVWDGGLAIAVNTGKDDGGVDQWLPTPTVLPVGQWNCLELALDLSEQGTADLYLNGALVESLSGVDTLPAQGITQAVAGLITPSAAAETYVDELVVSPTPIGCDP